MCHLIVNEVSSAGTWRIDENFVVLLENGFRSVELVEFLAIGRIVGFELSSEVFVSGVVEFVGVCSCVLGECDGLPTWSSTHIKNELVKLRIEGVDCEKGGCVEIVMCQELSCSFRRCESVLLYTSQRQPSALQLRIIREGFDQGGMAGGLKEGGVEGIVPAFGAVDGGTMGVECGTGGGGAFEAGFGGR